MTFDDASHREIQPPRVPRVPLIGPDNSKMNTSLFHAALEVQRLRDRVGVLEFDLEAARVENVRLQKQLDDRLARFTSHRSTWAVFSADEQGVYVTNPQTDEKVKIVTWHAASLEKMRAYAALCHYPLVQDESCNRERGHDGEHAHLNSAQLGSEKYAPSLFPSPRPPCNMIDGHLGACSIIVHPNFGEIRCGKTFHPDSCDQYCRGHANV